MKLCSATVKKFTRALLNSKDGTKRRVQRLIRRPKLRYVPVQIAMPWTDNRATLRSVRATFSQSDTYNHSGAATIFIARVICVMVCGGALTCGRIQPITTRQARFLGKTAIRYRVPGISSGCYLTLHFYERG